MREVGAGLTAALAGREDLRDLPLVTIDPDDARDFDDAIEAEIEAAREGRLPRLVELGDIRGDLHSHTAETDGRDSLADMAAAARRRGRRASPAHRRWPRALPANARRSATTGTSARSASCASAGLRASRPAPG